MSSVYTPRQAVVGVAKANPKTGVPRCATPGCPLHAVVRATVDVHFTDWSIHGHPRPARRHYDYLACLPCYGRLRQAQADAYVEIVAVEPVR